MAVVVGREGLPDHRIEQQGVVKIPTVGSEQEWNAYHKVLPTEDLARKRAVTAIEKWWLTAKDKRIFSMLKDAICASEYSLTQEIVRKVNPAEAELLGDPAIQAKVKFRFGGDQFPPFILFKIFTSINVGTGEGKSKKGGGVKYISGRRMIKPASEAAADAKRQMGHRRFCDQMLEDAYQHQCYKVTDEVDIITMKEYMQFMAKVDEGPAYLGGKENTWRRLDLTVLPRHSHLHHLVHFLNKTHFSSESVSLTRLKDYMKSPAEHMGHEQHSRVMVSLSLSPSSQQPNTPQDQHNHPHIHVSRSAGALRRSRQAKQRANKMRKAYREKTDTEEGEEEEGQEMREWEQEADDLYQWTQQLSFDDIT